MLLTGFDVPQLGTMYIDKLMKVHNLMKDILSFKKVYNIKKGGLIVGYIGQLLNLLKTCTIKDQIKATEQLANVLLDKLEIMDNMFNCFDYPASKN